MVARSGVLSIQQILHNKQIITVTLRDEPIVIMTSEEVADVDRHGSDIESLAPQKKKRQFRCRKLPFLFVGSALISCASCAFAIIT